MRWAWAATQALRRAAVAAVGRRMVPAKVERSRRRPAARGSRQGPGGWACWRGRGLDNVFCERRWRSVKYDNIYLQQYDSVRQLQAGLRDDFDLCNHGRPRQSLNYRTPAEEQFVL